MIDNVPTLVEAFQIVVLVFTAVYLLCRTIDAAHNAAKEENIGQGYLGVTVCLTISTLTLLYTAKEMIP